MLKSHLFVGDFLLVWRRFDFLQSTYIATRVAAAPGHLHPPATRPAIRSATRPATRPAVRPAINTGPYVLYTYLSQWSVNGWASSKYLQEVL